MLNRMIATDRIARICALHRRLHANAQVLKDSEKRSVILFVLRRFFHRSLHASAIFQHANLRQ